jgi:hypothetical protein
LSKKPTVLTMVSTVRTVTMRRKNLPHHRWEHLVP